MTAHEEYQALGNDETARRQAYRELFSGHLDEKVPTEIRGSVSGLGCGWAMLQILAGVNPAPVSPVLANIYLHYVLDLWFEKCYVRSGKGRGYLIRYADDFVACFIHEDDARRFMVELIERLTRFGLEVEPSKTRLLRFGSGAQRDFEKHITQRPSTFNFLGFTHYAGKSRSNRFLVGRKSQRERIAKKLKEVGDRLSALRVEGGRAMMDYAKRHLQGHVAYYAVSGNARNVRTYAYLLSRSLFKWLNRRSQRRSVQWERFSKVLSDWMPSLRIQHNLYPKPLWMTQAGSRMV